MAIKTDMSKAYDRLEWDFIKSVLEKMGFNSLLIKWVMQCISTVSYTFIINGASRGYVKPGRGIRQGDPLSPYLFILCSDVLSGLCSSAQRKGLIKGVSIAATCPSLTHLLFADDTMFFCSANRKNAEALKALLDTYETVSGQLISKEKSSIFFSKRTNADTRSLMRTILGIDKEGGMGKYLGLPELFGRKKKDVFASVVDRIKQRAVSWSSKRLSGAGKMVMIKSVLAPMPSHSMSCFKIPQALCTQIQSTLTRFWWDSEPEKQKMSWISWNKMARPKKRGGLGFKDITSFNDALLAKLGWRILRNPSCLLARCLLGKYCKTEPFLKCTAPSSTSHGWRSVLIGRDLLVKQLGWVIGTGEAINVWNDPWLSHSEQLRPYGPAPEALLSLKVADLIDPVSSEWNIQQIEAVLPIHKEQILRLRPSILKAPDDLVWLKNTTGEYSTRSGYLTLMEEEFRTMPTNQTATFDWLSNVWNIKAAEKIKVFLWKSLHDALPVGEQFAIRNIPVSTVCTRCNVEESITHLFFSCPFAISVWKLAPFPQTIDSANFNSTREGWGFVRKAHSLPPTGLGPGTLAAWILWSLWISRNQLVFEKRKFSAEETIQKAIVDAREWTKAQSPLSPTTTKPLIRSEPIPTHGNLCSIFTDAAWNSTSGCAGLGWIIDDRNSSTQHSATSTLVSSPLMAETLAVLTAMNFALTHGIDSVMVFSDSQVLINTIKRKEMKLEIYGSLHDIYLLSLSFKSIMFNFIPRTANARADSVAKQALWALNQV